MANLKTLLYARVIALFISVGVTAAVLATAVKALHYLSDAKDAAKKLIATSTVHADDVLGAVGALCAAACVGVAVSLFSELCLFFEGRKKIFTKLRYINEFLLVFASVFLLATAIAATVITAGRSAFITAPGLPTEVLGKTAIGLGWHLKYSETWAFKSMILGWIAWFFLLVDLVLVIAAGLHYKRRDREAAAQPGHVSAKEEHSEHA